MHTFFSLICFNIKFDSMPLRLFNVYWLFIRYFICIGLYIQWADVHNCTTKDVNLILFEDCMYIFACQKATEKNGNKN